MGADSPLAFLQKLRHKVQSVTYGSPLYRMVLDQGDVPEKPALVYPSPWPGDAQTGLALIDRRYSLFDQEEALSQGRSPKLATHGWLKDLRAVDTDTARRKARGLIEAWMEHQDSWHEQIWEPSLLGERLSNWISYYDFYGEKASEEFIVNLMKSMARQLRHLMRTAASVTATMGGLSSAKGLIFGGLALAEMDGAVGLGLELLSRHLSTEILPDGGHIARDPTQHYHYLRHLIDIRGVLRLAQITAPPELNLTIQRMTPALKLFRHGDGGLALFNGSHEELSAEIDALIALSEAKGRTARRLGDTGYERLSAGRSLLIMDVKTAPPKPYDERAHAGLLSFEFSIGKERLIVNCGAGPDDDSAWRMATASTAAHSTVIINDRNACEVIESGGIGAYRHDEAEAQRYEQNEAHYVEASHDAYAPTKVHRTLRLSADGEELEGKDVLVAEAAQDVAIRFHLHPTIQASLVQGGQAAYLRTPSGAGWRFRLEATDSQTMLSLESSIYCGSEAPRRTLQLKIASRTQKGTTTIRWILAREKQKSAKMKNSPVKG